MSIYHCSIKIISRAGGRSAVASAAYRAGEKLHNEETGLTHDFRNKAGVIMSEILLPDNAPPQYKNREVLWNEVQRVESRSDARFAREVEVAFPIELTRNQQIECVRYYINENFVSKGMTADWALHDKGDGNPHAHIMLTCRPFNDKQEWDTKMKSVFANDRDAEGRPVYNPDKPAYDSKDREHTAQYRIPQLDTNGIQKYRERKGKGRELLWERVNIPLTDWNSKENAELWRASWAECCNRYLKPENQIDHRSYSRQGIGREPTIHEGITARKMEAAGRISDRCEINRTIREYNSIMEQISKTAHEITDCVIKKARDILGRFKQLTRSIRAFGKAGRDVKSFRTTAGRSRSFAEADRAAYEREQPAEVAAVRAAVIKRDAISSEQEITGTDGFLARADRKIRQLAERIKEKELERNARFERLLARRSASGYARRDAERDRGEETNNRKDDMRYGGEKTDNSPSASRTDRTESGDRQLEDTISELRTFISRARR